MLEDVVLLLNDKMFDYLWVIQQDLAPACKVKQTQDWLRDNLPVFIEAEKGINGSPYLNPID